MKKTAKTWVLFALEIIFMLIVPLVFVWVQYGDVTMTYKVSTTAIVLSLAVFLVCKKVLLGKWSQTLTTKTAMIETNALSITDKSAIESNKKAWRNYSIIQACFNAIIPLLLFVLAIITIKAVEEGLIKLYGCLIFCLISVFVGFVFKIGEIYSVKFAHEGDK